MKRGWIRKEQVSFSKCRGLQKRNIKTPPLVLYPYETMCQRVVVLLKEHYFNNILSSKMYVGCLTLELIILNLGF